MIFESKVTEENQTRVIRVSRRSSDTVEKWAFLEQDDESYSIYFYEKHKEDEDLNQTLICAYSLKEEITSPDPIDLEDIPLPDDLIAEIAKIRRKLSS